MTTVSSSVVESKSLAIGNGMLRANFVSGTPADVACFVQPVSSSVCVTTVYLHIATQC